MLEKDNCLMFKAVLGLVQSQSYQISSLFAMVEALMGQGLSDESRKAFTSAMENLSDNVAKMQAALDLILENDDVDTERLITELPDKMN